MSIGLHAQAALDGLLAQLSDGTNGVPKSITDIDADGAPTLTAIASYQVRSDLEGLTPLPHLALQIDGETEEQDWLTVQRDVVIPILVTVTHHTSDSPTVADLNSYYYARAVDDALNRRARNVTGVWRIQTTAIGIEPVGADRNRRRAHVRATMWLRTDRREA